MKKKATLLFVLFTMFITIQGQVPHAFKYQAAIRDSVGTLLSDKLISLKVSIIQGDVNGGAVYSEIHDTWTNSLGLINIEIGRGLVTEGDFGQISWGNDNHFIKLELDPEGGMNYGLLGITQLLAVPYALYAEKSGSDTMIVESQWKDAEGGIYYAEGNVGINKDSPQHTLDMAGTLNVDGNVYTGGNLAVDGDAEISGSLLVGTKNLFVKNDGFVGLGTIDPEYVMHIEGRSYYEAGRELLFIKNKSLDHFSHATLKLMAGEQEAFTYLTHFSETYSIFDNYAGTSLLWNSGNGLILRTDPGGRISFETTNYGEKSFIEHMRMTSEGNFGIGTINPKRTLHIRDVMRIDPRYSPPEDPSEGDIYMDGNDHRLKVFDGEIWRSCW